MKVTQAKQIIIKAYSELVGLQMAADLEIDGVLVLGVKQGFITAQQAAEEMVNDYTKQVTESFKNKQ